MMRPALSPAASGLMRGLIGRAGVDRNRIYLTDFRSTEWQSLTFMGERHEIRLRVAAPGASELANRLVEGLDDMEWHLPGHLVADVALCGPPLPGPDESVLLSLEALTIAG